MKMKFIATLKNAPDWEFHFVKYVRKCETVEDIVEEVAVAAYASLLGAGCAMPLHDFYDQISILTTKGD